ncbi:hypothetical protein [Megavirus chiliensis]|uniref:Uncharacterized protein n=2 Tax=Megamimivirinae TaxID=3044648 RepID=A0A2L2DP46_MIMIV|nr:hypothetical protein MegaChil _gp1105 [Megavirus chiliensis]AEQ32945.1 hypothetical protein [Megavirus chiliensis]AVG47940.1 hypothetical protein [Acanthamoeba polyphaga mimivirus]
MPIPDNNMLGYSQYFKIINGKIVPINLFAKIIVDTKDKLNSSLEIENIDY